MKKIKFVLCSLAFVFAVSAVQARPTMSYPDHSTLQPRQDVDGQDRRAKNTIFGERSTARSYPVINIKPTFEPSDLRVYTNAVSGGSVENNDDRLIELQSSGDSTSFATLETRKRGIYQADATALQGSMGA